MTMTTIMMMKRPLLQQNLSVSFPPEPHPGNSLGEDLMDPLVVPPEVQQEAQPEIPPLWAPPEDQL